MAEIRTIDDALARMDRNLDRAIERDDARGYFTAIYRGVTARVRDGIAAGEFEDGERMERFDVRFARYWLDAYDDWDRSRPVSRSWDRAFSTARRGGTVAQHLVLGINAHINLDLAVATAAVAPGAQVHELKADYDRINLLLAELLDDMQGALDDVSPLAGLLDVVGLGIDEAVGAFSLERARAGAWAFAVRLARAGSPDAMIRERDAAVSLLGYAISDPPVVRRYLWALSLWSRRQDTGRMVEALAEGAARR